MKTDLGIIRGMTTGLMIVISIQSASAQASGRDDEAKKNDWDVFVGAGVNYAPEYEGSDRYTTTFLPAFQVVWKDRVLLDPNGLGAFVFTGERLRVSTAIGYDWGRKESDSVDLKGLGNIDGGAVLALGLQYDLGPAVATADIRKFTAGSDGMIASIGLQSQVPFGVVRGALLPTGENISDAENENGLILTGGVSLDWADEEYNQSYFGVTAEQSAASGLPEYSAGAGFKSVSAEVGVAKVLGDNWALTGAVAYSLLLGDAKDSPVTKSSDGFSVTLGIGYGF